MEILHKPDSERDARNSRLSAFVRNLDDKLEDQSTNSQQEGYFLDFVGSKPTYSGIYFRLSNTDSQKPILYIYTAEPSRFAEKGAPLQYSGLIIYPQSVNVEGQLDLRGSRQFELTDAPENVVYHDAKLIPLNWMEAILKEVETSPIVWQNPVLDRSGLKTDSALSDFTDRFKGCIS